MYLRLQSLVPVLVPAQVPAQAQALGLQVRELLERPKQSPCSPTKRARRKAGWRSHTMTGLCMSGNRI